MAKRRKKTTRKRKKLTSTELYKKSRKKQMIVKSTDEGSLNPDGTEAPAKRVGAGKGDQYRHVDMEKFREGFDAAFPQDCEECGREAGLYTDGTYNYYLHVYNRPQGKKKPRLRLCDECNSGEERWGERVEIDG